MAAQGPRWARLFSTPLLPSPPQTQTSAQHRTLGRGLVRLATCFRCMATTAMALGLPTPTRLSSSQPRGPTAWCSLAEVVYLRAATAARTGSASTSTPPRLSTATLSLPTLRPRLSCELLLQLRPARREGRTRLCQALVRPRLPLWLQLNSPQLDSVCCTTPPTLRQRRSGRPRALPRGSWMLWGTRGESRGHYRRGASVWLPRPVSSLLAAPRRRASPPRASEAALARALSSCRSAQRLVTPWLSTLMAACGPGGRQRSCWATLQL